MVCLLLTEFTICANRLLLSKQPDVMQTRIILCLQFNPLYGEETLNNYSLLQRTHCLKSPQINSPQQSHHVGFRSWCWINVCPLPTCLTSAFSSLTFSVVTDRFMVLRFLGPFLLTKFEMKSFTGLLAVCFSPGIWGTDMARFLSRTSFAMWDLIWARFLSRELGSRGFVASFENTSSLSISKPVDRVNK